MQIKLNSSISITAIQQAYKTQKRHRIANLFEQQSAEKLCAWAQSDLPYETAFVRNQQNFSVPMLQLKAMPAAQRQAMFQQVYSQAASGVGFLYDRVKLPQPNQTDDTNMGKQFFDWLNSDVTLSMVRQISGFDDIQSASAQLTLYQPGQFLTRHNDINPAEQRRVAYVVSLTKQWHPDWGGMLQFFSQEGTPLEAWSPLFNSISLFDVKHPHSVTFVAPFARFARISITGWFLAN